MTASLVGWLTDVPLTVLYLLMAAFAAVENVFPPVPADTVAAFARERRNVTLTMLDDDHQLIASLPRMWKDVEAFLGLVD